ncbi:MAG TPA: guanylate kinase, partial [Reyranellaceae bacterium]|nr:guanylate kinase [Reyranellaceae bacterium]
EFNLLVNRGELLEYAKVFGHYYGTPKQPVEKALGDGRDVLFDIDWQGTQQLKDAGKTVTADLVTVFILPPSTRDLEKRLLTRAQDPKEIVAQRMAKAADEMSHYDGYDYVIVNRDIGTSLSNLKAILTAERLKLDRQVGLSGFVKALRDGR